MCSLNKILSELQFKYMKNIFEKISGSTIELIPLKYIPPNSMKLFEGYSARFIDDYVEKNFDQSFVIESDDYTRTFVVTQTKKYDNRDNEMQIYLSTLDYYAQEFAHGEIRFNYESDDIYFKDKPFANFTSLDNKLLSSDPEFVELRLDKAVNQLNMMNGLSHALYKLPLYSSTLTLTDEKPIWQHLLKEGKVTLFRENRRDRYVFNHEISTIHRFELN